MKFVSTTALAMALTLGAATTLAFAPATAQNKKEAAAKAPNFKLSKEVREPLAKAQTAIKAGDTATGLTQLSAAKAAAKTPDEQYVVGSVLFDLSRTTKDVAQQSEALDLMLASGKVDPAQLGTFHMVRGQIAYNAKDFARADQSLTQAIAANVSDPAAYALLAETKVQLKQPQQAVAALQQGLAKMKAAGQTPPNDWFGRGINVAYTNKMSQAAEQLTADWLNSYPTASNWRDSLIIYRDLNKLDADSELDLMRLMRAAKSLKGQADYIEYAQAVYLKNPGEAKAVLDEGVAAGYLKNSGNTQELLGIVTPKIAADKASLAKSGATAKTAAGTARQAVNVADGYLGYGLWNEAIELYNVALTKGGVDAGLVNTRLGIAQAQAGQKDAAKATFAKITGPRASLAKYWLIWLDKGSQAA